MADKLKGMAESPLVGGVWIEISSDEYKSELLSSPLVGGVWIEIAMRSPLPAEQASPLVGGVWIEIPAKLRARSRAAVTPRRRGVD